MPVTVIKCIKNNSDDDSIKILGTYNSNLLGVQYIMKDIAKLKDENKNIEYDCIIKSSDQIIIIKKKCGYIYNSKECIVRYDIIEVTDDIIDV